MSRRVSPPLTTCALAATGTFTTEPTTILLASLRLVACTIVSAATLNRRAICVNVSPGWTVYETITLRLPPALVVLTTRVATDAAVMPEDADVGLAAGLGWLPVGILNTDPSTTWSASSRWFSWAMASVVVPKRCAICHIVSPPATV